MADRMVKNLRPKNLDEAPEYLNQVQAAAALGWSVTQIARAEKEAPGFPRRVPQPFGTPKFLRSQLKRWVAAQAEPGAGSGHGVVTDS